MAETPNNLIDFADEDFQTNSITLIAVTEATASVIKEILCPVGMRWLYFDVTNTGAVAFDEFTIQRRAHDDSAWETIANAAGDYDSPQLPITEVQGAPVTLAAAATVYIRMQVNGTRGVHVLASGNGGATTATLNYRFGE